MWILQVYFGTSHPRSYISANVMGIKCVTGCRVSWGRTSWTKRAGWFAFAQYIAEDYFMAKAISDRLPDLLNIRTVKMALISHSIGLYFFIVFKRNKLTIILLFTRPHEVPKLWLYFFCETKREMFSRMFTLLFSIQWKRRLSSCNDHCFYITDTLFLYYSFCYNF